MNRAAKLSLAGFAWILAFVAVLVFAIGYKVEAQDDGQQLEVQESQSENQVQPEGSNQQRQDQESNPEQNQPEQNQEGQEQQDDNQNQDDGQQASNQGTYDYVAQPGDSYTLMARKAVQTYGLTNEINLSIAEIVYAETKLTKDAGEPRLEVGQQVQFQVSDVAQAVQEAQNLSEEKVAMWNAYAQQVPTFNTDNVGEGSVRAATTETEDGDDQDDSKDQQEQDNDNGDVKGAAQEGKQGAASEGGK